MDGDNYLLRDKAGTTASMEYKESTSARDFPPGQFFMMGGIPMRGNVFQLWNSVTLELYEEEAAPS